LKYINSKRNSKGNTGNLKANDTYGNEAVITEDKDKVEVFVKFFSSVFTTETKEDYDMSDETEVKNINKKIHFDAKTFLYTLEKINTKKSPGPDSIHRRVLYDI